MILYRILEVLSGQNTGIRIMPYRIAQALKVYILRHYIDIQ